ncbi:scavenger receptor cysteine-rich type 1 protein M130-like [Eudromia elegans]
MATWPFLEMGFWHQKQGPLLCSSEGTGDGCSDLEEEFGLKWAFSQERCYSYEGSCGSCEGQTGGKMGKGDPAVKRENLHSNPLLTRKSDPAPILASTVMRKEQGKKLQTETAHGRYKLESRPRKPPGAPVKPRQEEERRGPHCPERFPAIQEPSPEKARKGSRKESTVPLPPLEKVENRVEKWLEEGQGASGQCCQGRRLRMEAEGLLISWVLRLLVWVQLCWGAAEVRLEAGGSRCAGRVEVKHQGQWGTVCGDDWDIEDAAVVCKQLGCGSALRAPLYAYFGPGSGPIWLDSIDCKGTETALSECTHDGWGNHNCIHALDAGVVCSGFVRLVGGSSRCSGRVEIRDGDQWKTVCDSHFGVKAADIICRELQCGTALSIHGGAHFGEGVAPIWDKELQCVGNEPFLSSCPKRSLSNQTCSHANDAGVTCTHYTGFRLVNGSTSCSGRVEIEVEGTWGTLCHSGWDISDAHVLCHQLNCGFAESISAGGHFGRGTGPAWRDTFHCNGTESHLGQCPVTALGVSPCSPDNDAGVFCSGLSGSLRLVGGGSRCDGRVEMALNGTWHRVLDEQWDLDDASVVCRQLQCGEAEQAYNPLKPERGTGPVGLRRVQCAGKETCVTLCNTSLPAAAPAGIAEDVGVVCSGSRQVRLVHRAGRCAGRVEIYYKGTWGTVCDDSWDLLDATVVCRQLGCGVAVNFTGSAHDGEGSGQIWLDDVNCSGDEVALWDCPARPWGQHNCRHKEDAGVVCSEFMALRLENSDGCSGRLQVFYNGTWGSVCSDWMLTHTVSIVCKQLGCGDEGSIETAQKQGKISGTAWLDHVECGKKNSSFWQCPSAPWNPQSCSNQREETHITCSDPVQRRVRESGAVSVPVVICIILGALLCLLLALLARHVRSAWAQRRASRRSLEPFSEAVYQEIDYSQVWEEQERLGPPGSSSEGSLTKLQRKPRDSEEEEHPGSAPEVPVLPRGDPADGYDDAREVSDPGEDLVPAQRDWEAPREAEEGDGLEEAQRDTAYDDAEGVSLTHPPEDTKAVRLEPGAKQSLNPGLGEPIAAMRLGAAGTEERSVHLEEA